MSDETTFTYVLSRPAEVNIRVYTLSGRLVQYLDGVSGLAGYNQVAWNGLDGDGHMLANGVYLYKIIARTLDGSQSAEALGKLSIVR